MLANPRKWQMVRIHYGKRWLRLPLPGALQGRLGRVAIVGKGKPRNHGVKVGDKVYSIPCGNLRKVSD